MHSSECFTGRSLVALVAAALVASLTLGCGGGEATAELGVRLEEWSVAPAVEEVRAGRYTIVVRNDGDAEHQLLVVKDDLPPSQLPLAGDAADEGRLHVRGRIERVAPGETSRLKVELSAGKYVLICNLVDTVGGRPQSHYQAGMATGLLVLP